MEGEDKTMERLRQRPNARLSGRTELHLVVLIVDGNDGLAK
jgi:hypothetical protein